MATIQIRDYEAADDLLPSICMKCGEPATTRVKRTFSWYPRWVIALILVNLIVAAIVGSILTKRMTIHVPMCDQHRKHWRKILWVGLGGFGLVILTVILSIVLATQINDGRRNNDASGIIILVGCLGSVLTWLIALAVVSNIVIRPTKITDRSTTLTGVSEQFVEVLWKERDAAEAENEQRRARCRPLRDDRDDDDLGDIPVSRGRANSEDRFRE